MTQAKSKARANRTFIVQASLMIVTYECQNMFIVQSTERCFLLGEVNWTVVNWQLGSHSNLLKLTQLLFLFVRLSQMQNPVEQVMGLTLSLTFSLSHSPIHGSYLCKHTQTLFSTPLQNLSLSLSLFLLLYLTSNILVLFLSVNIYIKRQTSLSLALSLSLTHIQNFSLSLSLSFSPDPST